MKTVAYKGTKQCTLATILWLAKDYIFAFKRRKIAEY